VQKPQQFAVQALFMRGPLPGQHAQELRWVLGNMALDRDMNETIGLQDAEM
jgi:hypothetical protein